MERTWPLTGRGDELRMVASSLRPRAPGVVVAGPAGVGMTRLAREGLGTVDGTGVTTCWAQGSAAARPLPLGAFAGLLDVRAGGAAESIGGVLAQLRHRQPLVLAVDDAHLLDEHSALVVHRVVLRRLAPLLVTLRTGEPAPDIVTALWKDDLLPRLELLPLDAATTTDLVARVLGGPVDSASAHRLWTLTQGSPLFLRHLLTGEVSSGRFSAASGIWRWTRAASISPELASLLGREIGSLPTGVQDVVDLVTLGEPLPVSTLSELASPADLEEAERRGLVHIDGTVVRLAHPLYGEVRRTAMGTLRARRLRGRLAVTLASRPDPIPRAVLTLDSDLPADPALFLEAAEAATRMYDLPLAERLARAVAATGAPVARLVHAATLSWLSRGGEAEAIHQDLVATVPDVALRTMTQLHRTGNQLFTLARADVAREALAAAEATGELPLHVAAMSLVVSVAAGELSPALARGPGLLRPDLPDDLTRVLVASAVSAAAALTGGRDLLDEAALVGGLTPDRVPTEIPGFGLADLQVLGHRLAGTPEHGDDQARRMLAASADLPGPARLMGLVVAGHAAVACGRLPDAVRLLREARAGLAESTHQFRYRCRTLLATALGQAGDAEPAGSLLPGIRAGPHPAYLFLAPDDRLAQAWVAAAQGSTSEALDHAVAAAELARGMGAPAYEVLAWQTVVQLGEAASALPRLTSLPARPASPGRPHPREGVRRLGRGGPSRGRRVLEPPGRPRRRGGRGRSGGRRPPSSREAGVRSGRGVPRPRPGGPVRSPHARAGDRGPTATPDRSEARAGGARRARTLQQGDRRAAHGLGAHRGGPPLPGRAQARRIAARCPRRRPRSRVAHYSLPGSGVAGRCPDRGTPAEEET